MSRRDRTALTMLCMECGGTLRALRGWQPADLALEQITALLINGAGAEGLTIRQIRRLRRWAARWGALNNDLRTFYAGVLRGGRYAGAVGAAVAVIVGDRPRHHLSPSARGVIAQMWREENQGLPCPYSLFPNLDHAWKDHA